MSDDDRAGSAADGVRGRRIVVAGATSESGVAVCAGLAAAGASVVAVGSNAERLAAVAERVPGITTEVCDLSDSGDVVALALRLRASGGADGLVHLVGGWTGGHGIADQTDEGWADMERGFRTLRNTTRAFYSALVDSPSGRAVFVSSTSTEHPKAGAADYTAAKAAAESWMRSVADGFTADQDPLRAAAVTFAVMALVDDRMRAASPEKTFRGFTDVHDLAASVIALWAGPAEQLNGARIRLA
jgi:NAD(P)-dependent dehydrogenase (short-subunit alcohol dehydrogenase family)